MVNKGFVKVIELGQLLKTGQKLGVLLFLGILLAASIAIATIIITPNGTIAFQLEGFTELESINKQPGDLIKINLASSTNQEILFNAPPEFAVLSGSCVPDTNGKIQLQAGNNECIFAIEERAPQGNYNIIAATATKRITVIASPETLYVTNSQKLKQRYNNDSEVNSLMLTAYNKANKDYQKPGLVYDLAQFDNLEHPFASYPAVRDPINPTNYPAANEYVVQAAQLIREKCGNCKNIILIGDDFVIPHFVVDYPEWQTTYGNFLGNSTGTVQTNYLYTDQPFIPTTKMTFSNMGLLFSHQTISFVLPASMMNTAAVNELKQALRTTFEATILSDIDAASIQCNNAPLAAKTSNLIVIGNKNDNPAAKCFPWVDETSQTISLERNPWNDKTAGTKYAIVINSSDSSTTQGLAILIANNMLGNYQTTMIEKIDLLLNDISFIPDLPGDIASIVHDCGHIGASFLNRHEDDEGHGIWCIADVGFVLLPIASSKYAKIASGAEDLAVARFGKDAFAVRALLREAGYTDDAIGLTLKAMNNGVIRRMEFGLPDKLAEYLRKDPLALTRPDSGQLFKLGFRKGNKIKVAAQEVDDVTALKLGNTEAGKIHIDGRHIDGTIAGAESGTSFFPVGIEVRPGTVTPKAMTREQVYDLTIEAAQKGEKIGEDSGKIVIKYNPNKYGIDEMRVWISKSSGDIITSYPIKGINVISKP